MDVTLNKAYKANYLYNMTKRKQYIEDLRNIAENCQYSLTPINIVMDDAHIYCLPVYNSHKGDHRKHNRRLAIGLIYTLIMGDKLPEERSQMNEIGRNLVVLLEKNYSNPHLGTIIHDNF